MEQTKKVAFAVAAHPDDIEFMMAGTLVLLGQAGYELHYMNIANGCCGSATMGREETAAARDKEARAAAGGIGATFHPPLVNDLEIFYDRPTLARLCAVLRQVNPRILLVPSPADYMEDHVNAARLAVSAAFCRGMRNFPTEPAVEPASQELAVYHAMPYGLLDPLRDPVAAHFYVNVETVLPTKTRMLSCHRSQKEWLDVSQGVDSYLKTMQDMAAKAGQASGQWQYAEGWQRHLHAGFGVETFDPLSQDLAGCVCTV